MIAVVGGGITGLALGHHLGKRGADWLLFESGPRAGGVLRTVTVEGHPLDVGAQRTRLTEGVRELVEDVGLTGELVVADDDLPLFVYRSGKLRRVPFSISEAVATDLISWGGKLRILGELFTAGRREDETVERFFVRKFGREAYENLLGPLYGGLYASDPGRMPSRHALAGALRTFGVKRSILLRALTRRGGAPPETITFRDGMQALPEGLAAAHRSRVRLGTPVSRLRRSEGGRASREAAPASGDPKSTDPKSTELGSADPASADPSSRGEPPSSRFTVETPGGSVEADQVVLATPAWVSADLLEEIAPEASRGLRSLNYNRLAVVHLHTPGECELEGFGYQVALGEPLETRGVTFNAPAFGRDGVSTVYLGGMKNPELVDAADDDIGRIAAREFTQVTGCEARVLHVARTWIPAWDESWSALDDLALPDGVHLCANYTARPGVPGRVLEARRLAEELT